VPYRGATFSLRLRARSGHFDLTAGTPPTSSFPCALRPLRCYRLPARCVCSCGFREQWSQRYHPALSELETRCARWLQAPLRSARRLHRRRLACVWRRLPRRFVRAQLPIGLTVRDARTPFPTQGLPVVLRDLPPRRSCRKLMTLQLCRRRHALKHVTTLPRTLLARGMDRGPLLSPRQCFSGAGAASASRVSGRRK